MATDEEHPLDNPIWHALSGPHTHLGIAAGPMRRYLPEFAPFAAFANLAAEPIEALRPTIPDGGVGVMFTTKAIAPPTGVEIVVSGLLLQMVAKRMVPAAGVEALVELGAEDVPEMLELVELTRPGPFAARTVEMGRYLGLRVNKQLAAMAGERLKPAGFTEVSAVCTHPEHRRKGYAAALVSAVSAGIIARGETPFLHVLPENAAAIATYEALGFTTRRTIHLTVLRRDAS